MHVDKANESVCAHQLASRRRLMRQPGSGTLEPRGCPLGSPPTTVVPGVLAIGTWRGHDGDSVFHDFALIHRAGPGVVIVIRNNDYRRVLLSADDPAGMAASLRR